MEFCYKIKYKLYEIDENDWRIENAWKCYDIIKKHEIVIRS